MRDASSLGGRPVERSDWWTAVAAFGAGAALTVAAGAVAAQTTTPPPSATPLAKMKASPERVAKGQQFYRAGCALCHGEAGHGDGEVAKALKIVPLDLTQIAARNHGRFPRQHVYDILDERQMRRGHRTAYFFTPETEPEIREWLLDLVSYLESIQKTPGNKAP
jgi:mono/diheme cytochrome c family protein